MDNQNNQQTSSNQTAPFPSVIQQPPVQPVQTQPQYQNTPVKKGPNILKIVTIIFLVLLLLCACCGGTLFYITRRTDLGVRNQIENFNQNQMQESLKNQGINIPDSINGTPLPLPSLDDKSNYDFGDNVTLPEDFPKDVPIYPGSTVKAYFTNKDKTSYTANLTSKDDDKKIGDYYKAELVKQGWKEESAKDSSWLGTYLKYTKDNRNLSIVVAGFGEQKNITIVAQK